MRFFVVLFLVLVIGVGFKPNVSFAQTTEEVAPQDDVETSQTTEEPVETEDEDQTGDQNLETLDSLFADLKKQTRVPAANLISRRIWSLWRDSGSKSIDLLMHRAANAMNEKKTALALDVLAQVISLKPEYAEGWNRRATLYFNMKEYGRSIADIEQTLILEPRHFGALSGLAVILRTLGKDEQALETWYRVLDIYPANSQAQKQVIEIVEKLAGQKT